MDVTLVFGVLVLWLALVTFALALGTVARRADRLQAHAARQGEVLRTLSRLHSPSGKPFFPTPRHERQLLGLLAGLGREGMPRLRHVSGP